MKQFQRKQNLLKFWREWLKPMLIIVFVTSALRSALADWNDVPTGSMRPTILVGDRVFVNKLAYDLKVPFTTWHLAQWGDPERGEIVVFFSPADGKRLVKRVIGVPGDTIAMVNNHLFVNGDPIKYETLNEAIVAEIGVGERASHEFASESLRQRKHPVMITPKKPALRSFEPVTVPAGRYFMMGDNRDNSFDSRYYGCVERKQIVGQATAVVLSLDLDHWRLPRWHRFFTSLP